MSEKRCAYHFTVQRKVGEEGTWKDWEGYTQERGESLDEVSKRVHKRVRFLKSQPISQYEGARFRSTKRKICEE